MVSGSVIAKTFAITRRIFEGGVVFDRHNYRSQKSEK
jgi:hypothetical protein